MDRHARGRRLRERGSRGKARPDRTAQHPREVAGAAAGGQVAPDGPGGPGGIGRQLVDEGIAMVRDEVMPAVREMDGCIGLSLLVDRSTGMAIVTSAWETEDAMRSTEQRVRV
mgnify:CR=1 FL=1